MSNKNIIVFIVAVVFMVVVHILLSSYRDTLKANTPVPYSKVSSQLTEEQELARLSCKVSQVVVCKDKAQTDCYVVVFQHCLEA